MDSGNYFSLCLPLLLGPLWKDVSRERKKCRIKSRFSRERAGELQKLDARETAESQCVGRIHWGVPETARTGSRRPSVTLKHHRLSDDWRPGDESKRDRADDGQAGSRGVQRPEWI